MTTVKCNTIKVILKPSLLLLASFFALLLLFTFHVIVPPSEATASGQAIWSTATEAVFKPFSTLDIPIFLLLFFFVLTSLFLLSIFAHYLGNNMVHSKNKDNFQVYNIIIWTCFLLLAWSPYFLSWLPGGIFSDTYNVINQGLGVAPLTNLHTVLYSIFWKMCICIAGMFGKGMFVSALLALSIQSAVLAFVLSYTIFWLSRFGVNKKWCYLFLAFYGFFPLFPLFALSHWKDVFFSAAALLYGLWYFDVWESVRIDYAKIARVVLAGIWVVFSRNNGLYVYALATVVLLVRVVVRCRSKSCSPHVAFSLFIPIFLSLVICLIIQGPVFNTLKLNVSTTKESLGVPLQQIARTMSTDKADIPSEAREYFNALLPEDKWKDLYRPLLVDSIKWAPEFDETLLSSTRLKFFMYYLEIGVRNPTIYLEAYLLSNAGFWDPAVGWDENVGYVQMTFWTPETTFGMHQVDLFQNCFGFSLRGVLSPAFYISPAVFSWILFVSVAISLINRNGYVYGFIPFLMLLATLFIASPLAYSLRYTFTLVSAIPVFAFLAVVPRGRRQREK